MVNFRLAVIVKIFNIRGVIIHTHTYTYTYIIGYTHKWSYFWCIYLEMVWCGQRNENLWKLGVSIIVREARQLDMICGRGDLKSKFFYLHDSWDRKFQFTWNLIHMSFRTWKIIINGLNHEYKWATVYFHSACKLLCYIMCIKTFPIHTHT